MNRRWRIGLDSWVLQDGNYTDVVVGQTREFALEFGYHRADRLRECEERPPSISGSSEGGWYDVTATVVRAATEPGRDATVLDFGDVAAYTTWMITAEMTPPRVGSTLEGRVTLMVDHFAYMDELNRLPGMPPLVRTWTVEEIHRDLTPQVVVEPSDPRYPIGVPDEGPRRVRDLSRERWEPVDRASADVDGSYALVCALHPGPAVLHPSSSERPLGPVA